MRRDRKFGDDAGRRSLLQAFDVLGEQDPLVAQYRRRMASPVALMHWKSLMRAVLAAPPRP